MRNIKISKKWKETDPQGNITKISLIDVLNALISMKKPEDMPKGVDKARMFGRLVKAFDVSKETNELILEESEYGFLKKTIEEDLPSSWGRNTDMMDEIEVFLDAKSETIKSEK